LLVNFTDDVNLRPKNRGMKIQIFRALAHATLRALCRLLESPPRDWPCCDKPKTEFISGGRAPEAHHHVSVCDSCGKFNVVGDVNGQHFSVTFSLWHPNALIAAGRPIERIRNDEPASPIADLTVKATKAIRQAAEDVSNVILTVENRCLAADGPVTPTLQEMTEKELRKLWRAAQRIVTETPKRIHS
jgi:hypothetical protein